MTRWLCVGLVRCAKIWQHVLYAPRGIEVCWNETGRSQGNNVKALPENDIVDSGAI